MSRRVWLEPPLSGCVSSIEINFTHTRRGYTVLRKSIPSFLSGTFTVTCSRTQSRLSRKIRSKNLRSCSFRKTVFANPRRDFSLTSALPIIPRTSVIYFESCFIVFFVCYISLNTLLCIVGTRRNRVRFKNRETPSRDSRDFALRQAIISVAAYSLQYD